MSPQCFAPGSDAIWTVIGDKVGRLTPPSEPDDKGPLIEGPFKIAANERHLVLLGMQGGPIRIHDVSTGDCNGNLN